MGRAQFSRWTVVPLLGALLLSCGPRLEPPPEPARLPRTRLLVFVVIDQFGWEILERARPTLRGGLRRLLEEGVVFNHAFHAHANTLTAPGHATLATGLHPRYSGIVDNYWYDRDAGEEVYAAEARGRVSPERLLGSTVSDWIVYADKGSRSFAVAGKDRSAVLLAGHAADAAYWYDDETGSFASSPYYSNVSTEWLTRIQEALPSKRFFATAWRPLERSVRLAESFQVFEPNEGAFQDDFPHPRGDATVAPDLSFFWDVGHTPLVDARVAHVARRLVIEEQLGMDESLDFLGLSFSAFDAVGHTYGPRSLEAFDTILRLDRKLGALLEWLEGRLGSGRVLVVVSADHGVAPLPEARQARGQRDGREGAAEVLCIQRLWHELRKHFGRHEWFLHPGYLDPTLMNEQGFSREQFLKAASAFLSGCPNVRRVWTRPELETPRPPSTAAARAYWNAFHRERSPELLIEYEPYYVPLQIDGTTHGSAYPYDTHVPLIFWWERAPARLIAKRVQTVDVAPTLATLLGLPRPARLDGTDRSELILPSY